MRLLNILAFLLLASLSQSALSINYFVKANGNDSNDGRTHKTAWKTINKVRSFNFNTGDDLYFLAGDTWYQQLNVDWPGTDLNRAVIGSYYVSNGIVIIGVPNNTNKPTFEGTYSKTGDPIDTPNAVPSNQYAGLIQVSASYVTIQNLRSQYSSGVGITVSPKNGYNHVIFENNDVDSTAGASMTFQRTSHSNIMRNNTMRKCDLGWKNKDLGPGWAVCNGAIGSRDNLMEGNVISESYGEGIVAFDVGSISNVIRKNILIAVRSAAIYVDNGVENIVEENIVIGETAPSEYTMSGSYNGGALNLNVEDYKNNVNATGNIFRNNLVANVYSCIGIGMDTGARNAGFKVGGKFLGNTCVNTENNVKIWAPNANIESIEIANNIFKDTVNGRDSCGTNGSSTNALFRRNYWDQANTDSDCNGEGDVLGGLTMSKATGWNTISIDQIPTPQDFTPMSKSPVLKKGVQHNDLLTDYFGSQRLALPDIGAIQKNGGVSGVAVPDGVSVIVY